MFKKIDFFFEGQYSGSTNQSKTCKEAKAKLIESLKYQVENSYLIGTLKAHYIKILENPEKLKAFFDKTKK